MSAKFLRVLGIRSKEAGVVAIIDDYLVKWNPRRGWDCSCLTPQDEFECHHIVTIEGMLDKKVTTFPTQGEA
ncbi:hypothetical protein ACR5KS_03565 [Leucobacter sp. W1153]|uniref:hypothetical protein n=1 Tax=Leucobacter sp. W1153 TaxID=3439064 RepID=UPI003F30187F